MLGTPTAAVWPEGLKLASSMNFRFPQVREKEKGEREERERRGIERRGEVYREGCLEWMR